VFFPERDSHVPHPYEARGKITVFYRPILIFKFLGSRQEGKRF
jgi:hypothetical protein